MDPGFRRDDECDETPPSSEAGFTLIEMMVSLVIFAILSSAGVALLSFSVRAQSAANEALDEVATLRRVDALLAADLAQVLPRPYRDAAGATRPAFAGSDGRGDVALALVRGGWSNPDGAPRASAQRVEYRLAADRLERVAWPHVDGAQPFAPAVLLTGVRTLRIRYRRAGEWRDAWDAADPKALPDVVEVVTDVERVGTVRQLFLVGTGA